MALCFNNINDFIELCFSFLVGKNKHRRLRCFHCYKLCHVTIGLFFGSTIYAKYDFSNVQSRTTFHEMGWRSNIFPVKLLHWKYIREIYLWNHCQIKAKMCHDNDTVRRSEDSFLQQHSIICNTKSHDIGIKSLHFHMVIMITVMSTTYFTTSCHDPWPCRTNFRTNYSA